MGFLINLLSPVLSKLGELFFSKLFKMIGGYIDDWMAARKEKEDDVKIDSAFKNPDRKQASRDLKDVFTK